MKNKVISLILIFSLMLSFSGTAFAEGDGNTDGGGGMGNGTSSNFWSSGNDGVSVTIIDAEIGCTIGTPIDYTNIRTARVTALITHLNQMRRKPLGLMLI